MQMGQKNIEVLTKEVLLEVQGGSRTEENIFDKIKLFVIELLEGK